MSDPVGPNIRRRKRRVDVACDFCRRRKFGCDNAKPKCKNCNVHQKECSYSGHAHIQIPQAAKTSWTVPSSRDPLQRHDVEHPDSSLHGLGRELSAEEGAAGLLQLSAQHRETASEHRLSVTPNRGDTYRNLYSLDTGLDQSITSQTSAKAQLVAETAKQRQLEELNFRSNKFNFGETRPECGKHFFALFWNTQHAVGSILYRPVFMRDMATKGPYFSELLLNIIFWTGAKHHLLAQGGGTAESSCLAGKAFRQNIDNILYAPGTHILWESRITTIQALLLLADNLFSWCDERSLAWHYLGIAISMIFDLGIHSESSSQETVKSISPEEREIRRRVFWSAYVMDKRHSIYQARPARLRYVDTTVPMEFLDDYEELELFIPADPADMSKGSISPTYGVSSLVYLCKISVIVEHILETLYSEKASLKTAAKLRDETESLWGDIRKWRESLPVHLVDCFLLPEDSSVPPHVLSLMTTYGTATILLRRPFITDKRLKYLADPFSQSGLGDCRAAAHNLSDVLCYYKNHWDIKSPPYDMAYAIYVGATIYVRLAAAGESVHLILRSYLEILAEHQKVCHAPRRSMSVVLELIKRLRVDAGAGFTAFLSRTAGSEVNREGFPKEVDCCGGEPKSMETNSTQEVPPNAVPASLDDQGDPHATTDDFDWSTLNTGLEGIIPDMSLDFDTLFGFGNITPSFVFDNDPA